MILQGFVIGSQGSLFGFLPPAKGDKRAGDIWDDGPEITPFVEEVGGAQGGKTSHSAQADSRIIAREIDPNLLGGGCKATFGGCNVRPTTQ